MCPRPLWSWQEPQPIGRVGMVIEGSSKQGELGGAAPHLARSALLGGLEGVALHVRSTQGFGDASPHVRAAHAGEAAAAPALGGACVQISGGTKKGGERSFDLPPLNNPY